MRPKPPIRLRAAILAASLSLPALMATAQQTAPAELQVDLRIRTRPGRPESGVIAIIPDGGLLPRGHLAFDVLDTEGNRLEAQRLWHNPAQGLGLVFELPGRGDRVVVALASAPRPQPRRETRLRPGLLLYTLNTAPGTASLERALRLPETWPPVPDGVMQPINAINQAFNPMGADDHYLSWYTGWFVLDKAETIYFATVSDEGSSLRINGDTVAAWPGFHTRQAGARGQFGNNVSLEAGWHRIEYFHFEATGPQEQLAVWQRGGRQAGKLPEHMPPNAFAQSGRAELTGLRYRDGRQGAWIEGWNQPVGYLWYGEQPINLYRARAVASREAGDLQYRWNLGGGRSLTGNELLWLVRGETHLPVRLETTGPNGVVRADATLQSWIPPPRSRPRDAGNRQTYRNVYLNMVRAAPPGTDPCADWHADLWVTLEQILDPYRGGALLLELFSRAERSLQSLPVALRYRLEDRFVESLRLQPDPDLHLRWLERLEQRERDAGRRFSWRQERVSSLLYDVGDVETARRQASQLRDVSPGVDATQLALIRLGDVERFAGDFDRAAYWYGTAQSRQRDRRTLTPLSELQGLSRLDPIPLRPSADGPDRSQRWKVRAVQESSHLATITAYLEQDAVEEAFEELRQWERDSPMSKLSGDYPLAEARVYTQVGDHRRALRTLQAYREAVSMSSALPEAMSLELDALLSLRQFATARKLAEDMAKRFPGHPVADRGEQALDRLPESAADSSPLVNLPSADGG